MNYVSGVSQTFADPLTLSQPGGADYAHQINWHPRIFRPSYRPGYAPYAQIREKMSGPEIS